MTPEQRAIASQVLVMAVLAASTVLGLWLAGRVVGADFDLARFLVPPGYVTTAELPPQGVDIGSLPDLIYPPQTEPWGESKCGTRKSFA